MISVQRLVLTGCLCVAFAMPSARADAATRAEVKRMVIEEAQNSRVPPALALAVAKVESDFQDRALSTAGARGVMQIMPQTGQSVFGVERDELWNPRLNVQLGIDYLEQLYDQYGGRWDLALSHYNGGTLKGGKGANAQPHGYTRKYVADVQRWKDRYAEQAGTWRSVQVAQANGDDGWKGARTRVGTRVGQTAPGASVSGASVSGVTVPGVTVDMVAGGTTRSFRDHVRARAPSLQRTGYLSDFDNPNFIARLAQTRRGMDDFRPIVRWFPADRG